MLHRLTYLENRRSLPDNGTLVTDINVRDPMTALWVDMRVTNGSTHNQGVTVADVLSRIEVIDGGRTIVSLTGHEAYALAAFISGHMPGTIFTEVSNNVQSLAFPIFFGRWLGDAQIAFDPTQYTMPQIRLQWNLAAVRAVGVTGFATGSATVTYLAELMEGGGAPLGVLNAKEFYTFTSVGSGVEYIDLPRDYNMVGFMLRAWETQVQWYQTLSNVKLNADQGKFVPFDLRGTDFLRHLTRAGDRFVYPHVYVAADADRIYTVLKQDEHLTLIPELDDLVATYTSFGYGEGLIGLIAGGVAVATDELVGATVEGACPFGCAYVPLGDQTDPNDWFPAPSFRSLRLELTQANAGGAVALVTRQLETY